MALVGLLAWPGGAQTCNACGLGREVRVCASVEVPIWVSSTECSRWVRRNLRDHEHRWINVGCWSLWNGFCCYMGGQGHWISSERWFRALQAAEPARRPALVELANRAAFGEDRWLAREELERQVTELELELGAQGPDADLSPR